MTKENLILLLITKFIQTFEYQKTLFEWCYPELADIYKKSVKEYPKLNDQGELVSITEN